MVNVSGEGRQVSVWCGKGGDIDDATGTTGQHRVPITRPAAEAPVPVRHGEQQQGRPVALSRVMRSDSLTRTAGRCRHEFACRQTDSGELVRPAQGIEQCDADKV